MGIQEDLNEFDKKQSVMARQPGQNISKAAALRVCSGQFLSKLEGTEVNQQQGQGWPRFTDGECWAVWSDPTDELL